MKNEDEDTNYERHCRLSQSDGLNRKKDLDQFCAENDWVEAFFAKYTFEVDFMKYNNAYEICKTIDIAYKRTADKETIKEKINNNDLAISGKEILRLAEKFGKGWFSIMLSDNINHLTGIPEYILKAIAYCCQNIKSDILFTMAKYRLNNLSEVAMQNDKINYKSKLKQMIQYKTHEQAIEYYTETFKKDILTEFINIISHEF